MAKIIASFGGVQRAAGVRRQSPSAESDNVVRSPSPVFGPTIMSVSYAASGSCCNPSLSCGLHPVRTGSPSPHPEDS